jgi:hypothetical protein
MLPAEKVLSSINADSELRHYYLMIKVRSWFVLTCWCGRIGCVQTYCFSLNRYSSNSKKATSHRGIPTSTPFQDIILMPPPWHHSAAFVFPP